MNEEKEQAEKPKKEVKPKATRPVELKKLTLEKLQIGIWGVSPLIMHAWSRKAKEQMLAKQMKTAVGAKSAKDPQQDFEDSMYKDADGFFVFPSIAFKAAAVNAAVAADLKKTNLRQSFHVDGEYVPIFSKEEPTAREDMVRIAMGTADIRYRGEFKEWGTLLPITINSSLLSNEQLVNLFESAGFGIGVGEWRPERDGQFGRFKIATPDEMKQLQKWEAEREQLRAQRVKH